METINIIPTQVEKINNRKLQILLLFGTFVILIFVLLLGTILVLIHNSNNSKFNSNTTNNSSIANIPATSVVNSSNKTISYYNNYFDITLMLPPGWTATISKSGPNESSQYRVDCIKLIQGKYLKDEAICSGEKYIDNILLTKNKNTQLSLFGILTDIGGPDESDHKLIDREVIVEGKETHLKNIFMYGTQGIKNLNYKYLFTKHESDPNFKNDFIILPGKQSEWTRLDSNGIAQNDSDLTEILNILSSIHQGKM